MTIRGEVDVHPRGDLISDDSRGERNTGTMLVIIQRAN